MANHQNAETRAPRLASVTENTLQVDAPEMRVSWLRHSHGRLQGTRAQIEAEGILPRDFTWPSGTRHISWDFGGNHFQLWRSRPEGHKGSHSSWRGLDSWTLTFCPTGRGIESIHALRILDMQKALHEEMRLLTAEGMAQRQAEYELFASARRDPAFHAFKKLIVQKGRGVWAL